MWPTLPARCFSTWPIAAGRWRSCKPPKSTSAYCPPSTNLRVSAGKYLQRGPRKRVCVLELRLWRGGGGKPPAPPAGRESGGGGRGENTVGGGSLKKKKKKQRATGSVAEDDIAQT